MKNQETNPQLNIQPEVPPKLFVIVAATLSFSGAFIGSALVYLAPLSAGGIDMQELSLRFSAQSPSELRYFMRGVLLLNHLMTFLIPALIVAWIFSRRNWSETLSLKYQPGFNGLILGTFFILFAFPVAQLAMGANVWLVDKIEFLKPLIALESSSERLIEGLLIMPTVPEMLSSLLVMALVPAIGEELLFRGVFQQYIGKWTRKPLLSVFIVALLFSLAHFQVQRFLAIFLLGIVLGLLFYWTRNLWISIGAHFINNAIQVLAAYSFQDKIAEMNTGSLDDIHWVVPLISAMLASYLGYMIWKRYSSQKSFPQDPSN